MPDPIEVLHNGRRAIVRQNDQHPEQYLWIDVDAKTFFLGVLEPHMKRSDVRAVAIAFLERSAGSGR